MPPREATVTIRLRFNELGSLLQYFESQGIQVKSRTAAVRYCVNTILRQAAREGFPLLTEDEGENICQLYKDAAQISLEQDIEEELQDFSSSLSRTKSSIAAVWGKEEEEEKDKE